MVANLSTLTITLMKNPGDAAPIIRQITLDIPLITLISWSTLIALANNPGDAATIILRLSLTVL